VVVSAASVCDGKVACFIMLLMSTKSLCRFCHVSNVTYASVTLET
jgi:hypothetical protein